MSAFELFRGELVVIVVVVVVFSDDDNPRLCTGHEQKREKEEKKIENGKTRHGGYQMPWPSGGLYSAEEWSVNFK